VGTAQQRAAQDCAQVVGVLNTVTQHEERRFAAVFCDLQKFLHANILDAGSPGRHTLVVLGTAQLLQLAGGHTLDDRPGRFAQRGIIPGHARLHAVGQQQGVHPGFAFQQFGHGVFAPYQGGILLRRGLVCLGLGGLLGHAFFIFHLQCGYSLKRLGKALCGGVWQPFCRVWQPAQLSGMIR